jgi:hypothetical protein
MLLDNSPWREAQRQRRAEQAAAHWNASALGPDGKRAWFWQGCSWQVGRAWEIYPDGTVNGMCRDYGPGDAPFKPREPMQTHGRWPAHEVSWSKPADQYARPAPDLLDSNRS